MAQHEVTIRPPQELVQSLSPRMSLGKKIMTLAPLLTYPYGFFSLSMGVKERKTQVLELNFRGYLSGQHYRHANGMRTELSQSALCEIRSPCQPSSAF